MTAAISCNDQGWIPSVSTDMQTSNLCTRSLKLSLSTNRAPIFPHSSSSDSGDQAAQYLSILLKTEVKEKSIECLYIFFIPIIQMSSTSISPIFSLDLLLLLTYFWKLFLLLNLKFNCVLVFHVFTLYLWTVIL